MSTFRSLDELIRMLSRERLLLKEMFAKRKEVAFRYDFARSLVEYKEERIQFLIESDVIRDTGDSLEMSKIYLKFFEDVLDVNEDIAVSAVRDTIKSLEEEISYFLLETSSARKQQYLKNIRLSLRNIAVSTLRNVIDLKRNIDNTYKNEPNYIIKKKKLESLDEKRLAIASMIRECEKLLDERQSTFFAVAMDTAMQTTVTDVRYQLREAYHNLIELDRQIITYLNQIEYQSRIVEKLRRIKYLQDQMILTSCSDVLNRLEQMNPVWMEPRPVYRLKLSLEMLRNSSEGLEALKLLRENGVVHKSRDRSAAPLSAEEIKATARVEDTPNLVEMRNAFLASGLDLYSYVMAYEWKAGLDLERRRVLFCQLASQFQGDMNISDTLEQDGDILYPVITAR